MYEHIECTKEFIKEGLITYADLITWCNSNLQKYEPNTSQYNLWHTRFIQFYDQANILIEQYFNAKSERTDENEDK